MKSISIDSENYVKATDIARELGYTADYVGQLCRARKVDAQLVGRSWYVSEDSIRSHKKTRYRNTKKATTDTITQSLKTKDLDSQESFGVPVVVQKNGNETKYAGQHFYSRTPVVKQSSYFVDETELIPEGVAATKTGRISVSLGDAQNVKIKSKSKEYDFNPTPRQEIRFSGSLMVSEAEGEQLEAEEDVEIQPEELSADEVSAHVTVESTAHSKASPVKLHKEDSSDIANKIKVKHLRPSTKKVTKKLPLEQNTSGVLGMQRGRISSRNPMGGTLKIDVPAANDATSSSGVYFILVSTIVAVVISTFAVGLEASVYSEGPKLITSYAFDFNTLLAAVIAAW